MPDPSLCSAALEDAPLPLCPAPSPPGFTLGDRLGQGGFAHVWAARRDDDGAPAAIKIGHSRGAVLVERFRREASALARIGPPHVARFYRSGRLEDGRPYIAMERRFERTLAMELVEREKPRGPVWAARRAQAILEALSAVHAAGIMHRDLKPANIFITQPEGRAVLIDFGLAHDSGASLDEGAWLTRPGVAVGTSAYMAPEQIRCDPAIDARADIYAFGVILFELLTHRPPFIGGAGAVEHGHLSLRPPRPSELAPVPADLEELTLACLAKSPSRRPSSVGELRRALADVMAGTSAQAPSGPVPSSRRGRLLAESRQTAVVLVAETSGVAPRVVATVSSRRGLVVRRRGQRYVSVFLAEACDHPLKAALAAARELVERHGARAAMHLASVTLRHLEQGAPAVYGVAVDRPEAWLPAEPWSGLAYTTEIEPIVGEVARVPAAGAAPEGVPPLVGRDDVCEALAKSAAMAFDGDCPGLFTLLGEDGAGKTRLAAVAAAVAQHASREAEVVSLKADPRGSESYLARETAEMVRRVLADGLDEPPSNRRDLIRALAEGLRRRARDRPMAVVLDDAHHADDALLDALECATLDGAGVRLWVVVAAHPRFLASRAMLWGARTQRHDRAALAPLDEGAGAALAAWLLLPADYPPVETLRRLASLAGGNPACIVDLVRSLRRTGAVRPRLNGRGHELLTAELDDLPPSAPRQWLAARRLAELPASLASLARVAAVLGPAFTEEELGAVLDGLDRAGDPGSPLDAGAGLSALSGEEIVARTEGERWAFRSAVLREAIFVLVDPASRAEIHRQALGYWHRKASVARFAGAPLEAVARHAAGCGAHAEAAGAWLELGEEALSRHRHLLSDVHLSAALGLLSAEDAALRVRALAARGKARYLIHRVREARGDFEEALSLAEALGDRRRTAELLLEDATALDWDQQFEASARRTAEARAIIEGLSDPNLALRLRVAEGRCCHRRHEAPASIALLEGALEEAEALGEHEPRVIALLLLSFDLVSTGSLKEAEHRFDEVIALAEAAGDLPHLGAAYGNRVALWTARGQEDRAVEDLHRVVALAREIGNPWLEHAAAYNVALMLYRRDAQSAALGLARRTCLLAEQTFEAHVPLTRLLLAEILLMLERYEEAADVVLALLASGVRLDPRYIPTFAMLRLVLAELGLLSASHGEGGWDHVMRLAAEHDVPIVMELKLLYWRARTALVWGRLDEAVSALFTARSRREGCAMWLHRFAALEAQLAPIST